MQHNFKINNDVSRLVRRIRKKSFSKKYQLDEDLIAAVEQSFDNKFLLNPPIHIVYLYLVDFVAKLCDELIEKDRSSIKILDWGTGKGHISYLLSKKGFTVTSCDIFEESADDSSFGQDTPILEKYGIKVEPLMHSYKLPYDNNSFDIVLSFGVLEHVASDSESISEIGRILTKGGIFCCFHLPQPYSWTQKIQHIRGNYYHDRFYTLDSIEKLALKGGLELLDVWSRALLPKNTINYPYNHIFEILDNYLTQNTPLRHLATNIEFIAKKITKTIND
jgi:2-polyprenyl-3-methyl-5-hydroxy-6-metoxy-1,4-benzoquinol methylase